MSTFDFSDVFEQAEDAGFGPSADLDVGTFEATIKAARGDGESKAGDPQLGFLFKADEGQVYDNGESAAGDERWLNLTFSEKGGKYAAADAKSLGLTAAMLNADRDAAAKTAVGQRWRIEVTPSKDGKYRNIRLKKRLDGDEPAKPSPSPLGPESASTAGSQQTWDI